MHGFIILWGVLQEAGIVPLRGELLELCKRIAEEHERNRIQRLLDELSLLLDCENKELEQERRKRAASS